MAQPRIRTIKPETWQDEKVGQLSRDARLLFIGLITMADDEGRLRAIPSLILGHVYPYDSVPAAKLQRWLCEVEASGLGSRYEVGGVPYFALAGWRKHQKINRPSASKLPPPPHEQVTEDSVNDPGDITEASPPRAWGRAGGSDRIGSDRIPPSPPQAGERPTKPSGNRQRDHERYESELTAWAPHPTDGLDIDDQWTETLRLIIDASDYPERVQLTFRDVHPHRITPDGVLVLGMPSLSHSVLERYGKFLVSAAQRAGLNATAVDAVPCAGELRSAA